MGSGYPPTLLIGCLAVAVVYTSTCVRVVLKSVHVLRVRVECCTCTCSYHHCT